MTDQRNASETLAALINGAKDHLSVLQNLQAETQRAVLDAASTVADYRAEAEKAKADLKAVIDRIADAQQAHRQLEASLVSLRKMKEDIAKQLDLATASSRAAWGESHGR
jgi:DNA repair ATPase RecN